MATSEGPRIRFFRRTCAHQPRPQAIGSAPTGQNRRNDVAFCIAGRGGISLVESEAVLGPRGYREAAQRSAAAPLRGLCDRHDQGSHDTAQSHSAARAQVMSGFRP